MIWVGISVAGGRVYDNFSGHAYTIEYLSGKVVRMGVLFKKCSTYSRYNSKEQEAPVHHCPINYGSTSGAMEGRCCCTSMEEISAKFEGLVTVGALMTDDDRNIRSRCRSTDDGEGKFLDAVPTSRFLADPGHRIKVMDKALFDLVTKTKI